MIFGDPKDFAIEAYHEPSGPEWGGFGRFCFHIQGVVVGNIRDNHCSLFDVTDRFRSVAESIENKWTERFAGLSDAEVFRIIDQDIYSDDPRSDLGSSYGHFDFLTNTAEMFDPLKIFIFCSPDERVHILYKFGDDTFGSGRCSAQTFCTVVGDYVRWFDEQVRTTAPPYFPINPFDLNEKVSDD